MREVDEEGTIAWLLASSEPGIVLRTRVELVGDEPDAAEVGALRRRVTRGPVARTLLDGIAEEHDGKATVHPYQKWTGAHWRLAALVDLALPQGHRESTTAARHALDWLHVPSRRKVPCLDGRSRHCASQEGNALASCVRLGMADDPDVADLATWLREWQWPDGGWNCDKKPHVTHSSFNESLTAGWGLAGYAGAAGDADARASAVRSAEFFLQHRLFRSHRTGEVGNQKWLRPDWPPYWHYDVIQALRLLDKLDLLGDERATDGLELVESWRLPDGRWTPAKRWWRPPGSKGAGVEVVDWRQDDTAARLVTLHALTVLRPLAASPHRRLATASVGRCASGSEEPQSVNPG